MKQCTTPASQGNLFVKGFDLRKLTTGLRRLRPGTRALLSHTSTHRYSGTTIIRAQRADRKLTLNSTSLFGVLIH